MTDRPTHEFRGDWSEQLVATAIHGGHDLRPQVAEAMVLAEDVRRREEDPYTDVIGAGTPTQVLVHRSRFEMDLNRPRESAIYRRPEDAWDLEIWRDTELAPELVEESLAQYDAFYAELGEQLDRLAARGPFVVYDVHSYNHRREGADAEPAPADENPEVNLGTGTVDARWRSVVDAFTRSLAAQEVGGHQLDVRENVKFEGRALSWFVHERYPETGVCLALEFKKTFMDEWTDTPDHAHLEQLQRALTATHEPVLAALQEVTHR
ncbi:N-formylglutamate amidohydrolase [Kytococcus aerolatus]|uniref:N-formylglutamate amidohydrolase n=1 Tax=Kytococcus aerolatus TaxID=592308 RepID=A0A212U5D2_9MICO|nr:N-formylglutamate amidohydrolase [Kytococcus aerolatus]SNC73360.1 N-formylglutamate amidohydrolase [Kytococcus aerolatus]